MIVFFSSIPGPLEQLSASGVFFSSYTAPPHNNRRLWNWLGARRAALLYGGAENEQTRPITVINFDKLIIEPSRTLLPRSERILEHNVAPLSQTRLRIHENFRTLRHVGLHLNFELNCMDYSPRLSFTFLHQCTSL